ncbi:hypothetical protein DVH24_020076 [Malus domestica]|uniref:Uncharacterized protein n=1 Tax=Malus domestica TaxID=3750 RepID=A0A498JB59_MALDO|nr:hypothetical protein DVH24_020076 [Malus domestica]
MDPVDRSPSLLALKELILLKPWKTPPSPLCHIVNMENGSRVYRAPKTMLHNEENDDIINVEIPYEGLFEFIDKFVVRKVRVLIERVLGEILSLPKYDAYHRIDSVEAMEDAATSVVTLSIREVYGGERWVKSVSGTEDCVTE